MIEADEHCGVRRRPRIGGNALVKLAAEEMMCDLSFGYNVGRRERGKQARLGTCRLPSQ